MNRPTVAVVSSCYGAIDEIVAPPAQSYPVVDWVMVTDGDDVPAPWRRVKQDRAWAHPRFAAKHAKCLPFDYVDTDIAIWLDSGARILSADFVAEVVGALLPGGLVACWDHPQRTTIADEAVLCMGIPKYAGMDMVGQVRHYTNRGYVDNRLFATGCIVWERTANPSIGRRWLAEQLRWGVQDQISFPYVLSQSFVHPKPLPGGLYNNGLVAWTAH